VRKTVSAKRRVELPSLLLSLLREAQHLLQRGNGPAVLERNVYGSSMIALSISESNKSRG